MAFFTGTASNYLDLMGKVKGHVTGADMGSQAWTCLRDRVNSNNTRELIFRAPGLQGQDQIFVGMKTFFSTSADYYNWVLNGYIGFADSESFELQPGSIYIDNVRGQTIYPPQLPMWNQSMPYWLAVNGRRMVMTVKVSTRYESMYLGLLKPYGAPGQVSYPLVIGGSLTGESGSYKYTLDDANHNPFVNPQYWGTSFPSKRVQGTLRLRDPNGMWQGTCNGFQWNNTFDTNALIPSWTYGCQTWPYSHRIQSPLQGIENLLPNLDGSYPLFPIIVIGAEPNQMIGELDDVYVTSGIGNSPESIITMGSDKYFVTCCGARIGASDFWCFKMA